VKTYWLFSATALRALRARVAEHYLQLPEARSITRSARLISFLRSLSARAQTAAGSVPEPYDLDRS
jgi:hypothetical protein